MNKTVAEAEAFIAALLPRVSTADGVDVAVCVPFTDLRAMVDSTRGSRVEVYAQNMHQAPSGAFTGEVSAPMLTELDAQDFLQLFYGPNELAGPNSANYKNPAYDKLYDRMNVMAPGAERDDVIKKMLAVVDEDCPWSYTDHRAQYSYYQPWLKNFKYLDINPWLFKYYRVDRAEKARVPC